jgi:hypothetical protein
MQHTVCEQVEKTFVERIFAINPSTLGFKGSFFSKDPVSDVVTIPAKVFEMDQGPYDTGINFMPQPVFQDYHRSE